MVPTEKELFAAIDKIPIIDPWSRVSAAKPTAESLADILLHHHFTELAHSSGMDPDMVKYTVSDDKRIRAVLEYMPRFSNTAPYHWFVEMANTFFGIKKSDIDATDYDQLVAASSVLQSEDWEQKVVAKSQLQAAFVPYDYSSPPAESGRFYLPVLQTDDLVAVFDGRATRARLNKITDIEVTNASSLRLALHKIFDLFEEKGFVACSCAIPPDIELNSFSQTRIDNLIIKANSGKHFDRGERNELATFILVELSYRCQEHNVPFHLRVGGIRDVYDHGIHGGTDLLDQRTSLFNLRKLFNMFPKVFYPVSIISHPQNHELVSYSWIYHNVVACGHWSFSDVPTFVTHDLSARLQAIPRNKIIGYFSEAPTLEFVHPKFKMFKTSLARVLARDFVVDKGWSHEKAIDLARDILLNNIKNIFNLSL